MIRSCAVLAVILGLLAFAGAGVRGEDAAPEPAGYRNADYRAPTPATLAGARVVTTAQAEALWQDKTAIFVDVMPRPPRPPNLPPGTVWRDRPRSDIPGSIWLPETGYGELAPVTESYLRQNLEHVTGGDRARHATIVDHDQPGVAVHIGRDSAEHAPGG